VAAVESDLLIAKPRAPREKVEGEDDGEAESVSAIFREVREAKAAEDEKRGRTGRSGSGGRDSGRPGGGSRERSGPRPGAQRERKPAPAVEAAVEAAPVERPAQRPAPSSPMQADPNAPARKRRRRRGGRPVGDAATVDGGKPRAERGPEGAPAKAPAGEKPSLFGRLKAGLKSLVKRTPPTGH